MQRYFDYFRDSEGVGYPGASVTVYLAGTSTLASLYAAQGDIQFPAAINNPTTTDPTGFFGFAVPNGVYDIIISGSGVPTITRPNITITDLYGTFVPSGVLTVGAVAPVVSSGGQNPAISMAASTDVVDGYMTAADHTLLTGKADKATTISTTAPLQGGGSLAANRTFSISQAGSSQDGFLSQADYVNFNTIRTDLASKTAPSGSSLIGWISKLANSVGRWLRDKLEERISVEDFGAIGDWNGTTGTDDTVALQAAINATAPIGKRLYWPAKNYKFSSLTIPQQHGGVDWVGESYNSDYNLANGVYRGTVLYSTLTTGDAISGDGGVSFSNRGIRIKSLSIITNTTGWGIHLYGAPEQTTIQDVSVFCKNTGGCGIFLDATWAGTMIDGCSITSTAPNTGVGIKLDNTAGGAFYAGGNKIHRTNVAGFATGIYLGPGYEVDISFSGAENGVTGFNSQFSNTEFTMSCCHFEGNSGNALLLNASTCSSIRDTSFYKNGTSATPKAEIIVVATGSTYNYCLVFDNCHWQSIETNTSGIYCANAAFSSGGIIGCDFQKTSGATGTTAINFTGTPSAWFIDRCIYDTDTTVAPALGWGSLVDALTDRAMHRASAITFPATQIQTNEANTLDDYEEKTYTPTVYGSTSAGTATYSQQLGEYTKVGRIIHLAIAIAWTGHTGTGDLRITLPFAPVGGRNWLGNARTAAGLSVPASTVPFVETTAATVGVGLYAQTVGSATTAPVAMAADGYIALTITYPAAT